MSYRNPAYLAKVAATVDHVSEGRVEMGIGAGWYEHEWLAYGYGFPRAGERLARLEEGVEIFQQMWTTGSATFSGEHYQVDGARCYPRPLQGTSLPGSPTNGIPMWIAGGGEKKTLRIAAKYADYTNFAGSSVEEFAHKSDVLKGHCADLGRDYSEITRTANANILIGGDEAELRDRLAATRDRLVRGGAPDFQIERNIHELEQSPGYGTPEQVVERIRALQQAGLGYLITNFHEAAYDTTGIELFENQVVPELAD
jgi:alkanesulfonate monooxygenase SsuD/methylene tetrahydromethanopterin reductase-like flavin-dependent oxidoreductase (luciferase family)